MRDDLKIILMSLCLLILMICIHIDLTEPLDNFIYEWLHGTINSNCVVVYLEIISNIFKPLHCLLMILMILIFVFFYNQFKFWWYGFWCFSVLFIGTFFKYIIQRPRPDISIDGYSFPSMHVLSVCLLVSLILLLKNNKWFTLICTLLVISIIISRIYLRAHFFTDTIGSLLIIGTMLQALKLGNATSTQNNR